MLARVRPHAAVLGFVLIVTLTASLFAQQPKVLAPHDPVLHELPMDGKALKPAVLRSTVGGLWRIDANFKSSIQISNILKIAPLTITPILYLSKGKAFTLTDVTLEPSGTAVININDALNEKGIAPLGHVIWVCGITVQVGMGSALRHCAQRRYRSQLNLHVRIATA